jgi:SAM-dependent methyltransferase
MASAADWRTRFVERWYSPSNGWIDGTSEFHALLQSSIPYGSRILEIGAGSTNPTSTFLTTLGEVHGLDPDPEIQENTALTSVVLLDQSTFPYESASFDACVSNYVIEHVDDPANHLFQIARVLKPGGVYVFRTPNRFHYVAIAAWLLPHWVHDTLANRLRNLPEHAHAPHRTVYRLNSLAAIRRLAAKAGLRVETLRMVEKEPSYGMSSPLLFLIFAGYERLVNATTALDFMRANIFGVLRKPLV